MNITALARAMVGAGFLIMVPSIGLAGSPTDWVQATILEVRSSLAAQEPGVRLTPEQLTEMYRVFGERFSFGEMARMALGQHWRQLSPKQRTEFTDLFRKLLERSHMWEMSTHAGVEQQYVGESIEDGRAVVEALVKAEDGEIPINYFLLQHNGAWKIYDLAIDGVRLSQVYRAQFSKVISKSSFEELIRRMSLKLEEVAMEAAVQK